MKFVIISNRLPVTLTQGNDGLDIKRSGGGLATGLDSLKTTARKHWIGWPGLYLEDKDTKDAVPREFADMDLHPVFLRAEHIRDYYEGFSNSTLWPLCHYFPNYIQYDKTFWNAYREVNSLFCRETLKIVEPDDFVWVHDYQLMLLPAMLREHAPELSIGYFHHIPFPAYEMFRCLPERAEILKGLLGADIIGFHTHEYMRHFLNAAYRVLNVQCRLDEVSMKNRIVRVDAFPMGINYELYNNGPETPGARAFAEELRKVAGDCKIILSVDRLDYSKGIGTRLQAYANFLEAHPEYRGRVTLLLVVVPSRDNVEMYADLKVTIDTIVGHINGLYSFVGWTPIHYFYSSFGFEEICAMYNLADIALVTPLRDGMNLVAKEFVAAKRDNPGVLILSEMAGVSIELSEALVVNPTDASQVVNALTTALAMSSEDQIDALQNMQDIVRRQNIHKWAHDFFMSLETAKANNDTLRKKRLEKDKIRLMVERYRQAASRLLIFDYDGTLTPITKSFATAIPSQRLLDILERLTMDKANTVAVCSGRDKGTLERWLGSLPLHLSAEHGAFYRNSDGGPWCQAGKIAIWNSELLDIFENITQRTPCSRLEKKNTALVWHYREVAPWLAELRSMQLLEALVAPCARLGLQIISGLKIIEVKPADFNKGREVKRLLALGDYEFVMATGDDVMDEDMFGALPPDAISIKIGSFSKTARYWLGDPAQTLAFLEKLVG